MPGLRTEDSNYPAHLLYLCKGSVFHLEGPAALHWNSRATPPPPTPGHHLLPLSEHWAGCAFTAIFQDQH